VALETLWASTITLSDIARGANTWRGSG